MTKTTVEANAMSFPLYHDVLNPTLRTWNRVNTLFNIKELVKNNSVAVEYMKQLERNDQLAVWTMCLYIIRNGYETTRREIMRNNNA